MSFTRVALALSAIAAVASAQASSHREAPFITGQPKVDGTDFYMFRSYESGRSAYTTLIANYLPLQDSYGGPNYFTLDPDALYEIHIDNNGDAKEDLTFQFRFSNQLKGTAVPVPDGSGGTVMTPIPLVNIGDASQAANRNLDQTYTLKLVRGDRRSGTVSDITDASGNKQFTKPQDYIGTKSFPNGYANYANAFITTINIPGCATPGKVFVGQRREGFVVNLGQVFDLVNLNPLGGRSSARNVIGDKNITSLALEIPTNCLTAGSDPVIGGWTTASVRQSRIQNPAPDQARGKKGAQVAGGAWTQVSRLGSPLVNEVVIGITDKDKFNASQPKDDVANFGSYVLFPSLPVLVNALFSVPPPATPRNDLLAAFVTGVTTGPTDTPANFKFTAPANLTVPGEMLRLNTAIPPVLPSAAGFSDLGFLGCDLAGFPNGRRVGDDVVDIELTVAEGALTGTNGLQTCDLSGATPTIRNAGAIVNDGAQPNQGDYLTQFPYLNTPLPGATSGG